MAGLFEEVGSAPPRDRQPPTDRLAEALGAKHGIVFVLEPEVGAYLPALGYPQTISSRTGWRNLVEVASRNGIAQAAVTSPFDGEVSDAVAIAGSEEVLALFGARLGGSPLQQIRPLLRLLGRALLLERQQLAAKGRLEASTRSAQEASNLATQLDAARRDLERRVRERTADLEALVEELQGFTYTVSHDLRTPLRAVVSTSRILQEDFGPILPSEGKFLLERQAEAAVRLGQLIDDLLKLSRLTRQEMRMATVDLSAIAQKIASMLADAMPERRFEFDIQPGLLACGDPALLTLLLQNLLENAAKFSPEGGKIAVKRSGNVFSVEDQGIGFDMAYAHKIFAPFERLHRDHEYAGTGVGLANVQRIVHRHGGRVWAESERGKGARFYFTLPGSPA